MSKLAQDDQTDYADAAARHLEDAWRLLEQERWDNAAYLSGYVFECIWKTLIQLELKSTPPWTHDLEQLSRKAQGLASLPGTRTARYTSPGAMGGVASTYGGDGWNEVLRYKRTGSISATRSRQWIEEASKMYDHTIGTMWLDGVLS